MSNLEHIHPDYQFAATLPIKERMSFLDQPRWVGYPQADQILDTLRALMEKPVRPRMPNLLIVGEPNNGKTTLVRRFKELHGKSIDRDEDENPNKPVIVAEAPPSADEKGLYVSILERFFAPYRPTDPATKLRYQVVHMLRLCSTRVLVIDEFHSLLTGTPIKQREVMNAIKLLCNELAIPIVGVGTREAVRVLHTDPQHASRFDVVALPLWQLDKDFQRLLRSFEKILPLRQASNIHLPETASLIHSISGGNLGDLHRLLQECAIEAIRTGKEHIDKSILQSKTWIRPTRGIREVVV